MKPKKKQPVGRPSKYTPELAAEICRLIAEECCWKSGAAKAVGIDYVSIYRWEEQHPEFSKAIKKAIEAKIDKCLQGIQERGSGAVKGGDWKALAWLCERTFPERYSLNRRTELDEDADQDNKDTVSVDVSFAGGKSVAVVFKQESSVKEVNRAIDSIGPEDPGAPTA